jgi:3-deoxy-D-manno-octulosonic acid kinase
MIVKKTIDSYNLGFSLNLTETQLGSLTKLFNHPEPAAVSVLGGRTSFTPLELDGVGSVIIKHYRRGGLMRHLNERSYLKYGKTRAQREFELLTIVGTLGINVPQPIAYAHRGRLLYQAWLITREIHQPLSLASLSLQNEKKISALIQNDILHVDLHPGNVVVDPAGAVYLLDFDKGCVSPGNRQKLKNRYCTRWQRAVNKHGLPKVLTEMMQNGLN